MTWESLNAEQMNAVSNLNYPRHDDALREQVTYKVESCFRASVVYRVKEFNIAEFERFRLFMVRFGGPGSQEAERAVGRCGVDEVWGFRVHGYAMTRMCLRT